MNKDVTFKDYLRAKRKWLKAEVRRMERDLAQKRRLVKLLALSRQIVDAPSRT